MYSRGFERDAQNRVLMNANGTPTITSGKTVNIGNFNPDWMGGITNSLYIRVQMAFPSYGLKYNCRLKQG